MNPPVKFAAVGLDHRHIYGMTQNLLDAGAEMVCFHDEGDPVVQAGFKKRFTDDLAVAEIERVWENPDISLVLIAAAPSRRAELAIAAMRHGKDVMVDKPGCISFEELAAVEECVAETGRIWSVNFSERFEVRAVTKASELVAQGLIGRVIQTVGLGPHRLNAHTRPDWFFDARTYGGILTDIASHQIDQFLHFTGARNARIVHAAAANMASPDYPAFEDFGEINLEADGARGYVRVDWFTPHALPNWGDGRMFLLGTEGYIELRKYVDIAGRDGIDHLFFCTNDRLDHIDCSNEPLLYFERLLDDVANRTETACPQAHTFEVCRLALEAQAMALA